MLRVPPHNLGSWLGNAIRARGIRRKRNAQLSQLRHARRRGRLCQQALPLQRAHSTTDRQRRRSIQATC